MRIAGRAQSLVSVADALLFVWQVTAALSLCDEAVKVIRMADDVGKRISVLKCDKPLWCLPKSRSLASIPPSTFHRRSA